MGLPTSDGTSLLSYYLGTLSVQERWVECQKPDETRRDLRLIDKYSDRISPPTILGHNLFNRLSLECNPKRMKFRES